MVRPAFMLARLDEPLRPIGAVKTAEAKRGRLSLQSLLRMSRATPAARGDEAILDTFGLP
jgi:hypothetical protein